MRLSIGSCLVSTLGNRACVTKEGVFEFFPTRQFFANMHEWRRAKGINSLTLYKSSLSGMRRRIFDLEHRLALHDRHTHMAFKLKSIFDYFDLPSRVIFKPHTYPFFENYKNKYVCGVWYENEFYMPHKMVATYLHYHGTRELEILDKYGNWVHLAPCGDKVYIRGVLTQNLAQYANILAGTYTLRLTYNTNLGKKSYSFLVDI